MCVKGKTGHYNVSCFSEQYTGEVEFDTLTDGCTGVHGGGRGWVYLRVHWGSDLTVCKWPKAKLNTIAQSPRSNPEYISIFF